jgi:hypothetical protein
MPADVTQDQRRLSRIYEGVVLRRKAGEEYFSKDVLGNTSNGRNEGPVRVNRPLEKFALLFELIKRDYHRFDLSIHAC